eukprot:1990918-Amphidinium_carterae.2
MAANKSPAKKKRQAERARQQHLKDNSKGKFVVEGANPENLDTDSDHPSTLLADDPTTGTATTEGTMSMDVPMHGVQAQPAHLPSTPIRRSTDDDAHSNYLKGKGVPIGTAVAVLGGDDTSTPVGTAEFPASQRPTLEDKIDRLLQDNEKLLSGQQSFITRLSSLEKSQKTSRGEIDSIKSELLALRASAAAPLSETTNGSIFARRASDAGGEKTSSFH